MKKIFSILIIFSILAGFALAEPGTNTNVDNKMMARMAFAPVASSGLQPVVTENGKVYMSIDGMGTTSSSGLIQVNKTTGSTVRKAYLMSASTGFSNYHESNSDVAINGNNIAWTTEIPNGIQSYNYFTDVTSIVKPIIDGSSAGIIDLTITEQNSYNIDGEILVVIFDDPSQVSDNTVVLAFGAQQTTGDSFAIGLSQPVNKSLPGFGLDMSLGISFGYQPAGQYSQIDINGQRLTTSSGGQDDGMNSNGALITAGGIGDSNANPADPYATDSAGPRADDELYSLLPFVNNGDTTISAVTLNPSNDDNIFFAGFYLGSTTAVIGEGIILDPQSATNYLGASHTVTASVQDTLGNPVVGKDVYFNILSGPNAGLNSTQATASNGKAAFTYVGNTLGTDVIQASFYNDKQELISSNQVTKEWVNRETKQLPTIVNGHIYGPDGKTPVSGVEVEVTCNDIELHDTTNAAGFYVVEFLEGCDTGSLVIVESNGHSDSGTVANRVLVKNLVYINLSVPEFGTIAAIIALVGSVAVFAVIRKRR